MHQRNLGRYGAASVFRGKRFPGRCVGGLARRSLRVRREKDRGDAMPPRPACWRKTGMRSRRPSDSGGPEIIAAPCVLFVGEGWPGVCPSSAPNAQAAPIPKGSLSVGDDSIPLRPVSPTDAGTTFRGLNPRVFVYLIFETHIARRYRRRGARRWIPSLQDKLVRRTKPVPG